MPKKGGDELLSLKQAADIAKYEVSALRRLAIAGKVPARKIGNQWVVVRADLDKWMTTPDYHPSKGRPPKRR